MSERKKIDRLAAVPVRIGLLFLDLTQIFDDCLYAALNDGFGIAGKIDQRCKRVSCWLCHLPQRTMLGSGSPVTFPLQNGRAEVPTSPNGHLCAAVRCSRLTPINFLVNSTGCKNPIVSFGEDCQIGGLLLRRSTDRTRTFAVGTVTRCTLRQILRLTKIENLRANGSIQCDHHDANCCRDAKSHLPGPHQLPRQQSLQPSQLGYSKKAGHS